MQPRLRALSIQNGVDDFNAWLTGEGTKKRRARCTAISPKGNFNWKK